MDIQIIILSHIIIWYDCRCDKGVRTRKSLAFRRITCLNMLEYIKYASILPKYISYLFSLLVLYFFLTINALCHHQNILTKHLRDDGIDMKHIVRETVRRHCEPILRLIRFHSVLEYPQRGNNVIFSSRTHMKKEKHSILILLRNTSSTR